MLLKRLYLKLAGCILHRYLMFSMRKALHSVSSYEEYQAVGSVLDKLSRHDEWKANKVSSLYDYEGIEIRLENMRQLRQAKDINGLVHCLRQDLLKNLGGICDIRLYSVSYVGTK